MSDFWSYKEINLCLTDPERELFIGQMMPSTFEKMLVENFDHDSERDFHFFTGSSLGDHEKK